MKLTTSLHQNSLRCVHNPPSQCSNDSAVLDRTCVVKNVVVYLLGHLQNQCCAILLGFVCRFALFHCKTST